MKSKIAAVKNVANALFTEWDGEIKQIKDDPSLQSQSRQLLDKTKASYNDMIVRMDSAAATMDPVLTKFHNRVLFIKHNLNAQAIASLQGQAVSLEGDVGKLVEQMEVSIREANAFIESLPKS